LAQALERKELETLDRLWSRAYECRLAMIDRHLSRTARRARIALKS
jgi:hypothetical protein